MYVQQSKAGKKEFFWVLVMIAVVAVFNDVLQFFLSGVPLVKEAALIGVCAVLVYLIYQHYAAVFEYRLDDGRFYIERRIGHRINTISFLTKDIEQIYFGKKPKIRQCRNRCVQIFSGRKTCYIVYEKDKAVACAPDNELVRLLEECVYDKYSRCKV